MSLQKALKFLTELGKLTPEKLIKEAFENEGLQKQILDLNRIDQLFDYGIDANGRKLRPAYSINTINGTPLFEGKIDKGLPTNRVTLFNEGNFYASFELIVNDSGARITADDINGLADRYGKDIIGLTKENQAEAIQYIRGRILQDIQQTLIILLN